MKTEKILLQKETKVSKGLFKKFVYDLFSFISSLFSLTSVKYLFVVARCLDFTVSSHGEDEKKALEALDESIREYILTAVEDNAIENVLDPAHGKYWRMYNELESKQLKKGLRKRGEILVWKFQ